MSVQAPEIDGTCYINEVEGADLAPGQLRVLRVTEAHDYDVVGTALPQVLAQAPAPRAAELFPIFTSRPEASAAGVAR
jgi:ribosomal protein S12 methylthiotransferase